MDIEEEESEAQLQRLETVAMGAQTHDSAAITSALVKFARIQMALSRRAHKQTRHVIILTWCIAALTLALLFFTIYLSYDAYQKNKIVHEEQLSPPPTPKPEQSP
jgi:hypothetical protein